MNKNPVAHLRPRGPWALLLVLASALVAAASSPSSDAEPDPRPARDTGGLVLAVDEHKVLGWLPASAGMAGREVRVETAGGASSAIVQRDGTFTYHYEVAERTRTEFAVGEHSQVVWLEPRPEPEPCIYFVADRPVYRPGHEMRFAAFLRTPGRDGELVPLGDRDVEVRLVSRAKKTVAKKWTLRSDATGFLSGEYSFNDEDALDTYDLEAVGFRGATELQLGEFRKAKVRLDIDAALEGRTLELTFRALDFLGEQVPGSNVTYTASVHERQSGVATSATLAGDRFAYADEGEDFDLDFEGLSEDHRLLWEVGEGVVDALLPVQAPPIAQLQGEVFMGESGLAEVSLELEREWTDGAFTVVVDGVLIDYNGREQRTSEQIDVGAEAATCDLLLGIDDVAITPDEPFTVSVTALGEDGGEMPCDASIVAMRLSAPRTPVAGMDQGWYGRGYYSPRGLGRWNGGFGGTSWLGTGAASSSTPHRAFVDATVVRGGEATLRLREPGAYKLVCVAELADGRRLENEIGCVVQSADQRPQIELEIDSEELSTGAVLKGVVRTELPGSRALLTLRDAIGVRTWRVLELEAERQPFELDLPAGLRYGCRVEVQLVDGDGALHHDQGLVRVRPTDRTIGIAADLEEIYEPGDEVEIALSLDRREAVDLVVSVYDQSLLGIAADNGPDVRDFFLADERGLRQADRDRLRRLLGGVTVAELIERAEQLSKQATAGPSSPEVAELTNLVSYYESSHWVGTQSVPLLLELAGVPAQLFSAYYYWWGQQWYYRFDRDREKELPVTLHEVLTTAQESWEMRWSFAGSTVVIGEVDTSGQHQPFFGNGMGWSWGSPVWSGGYGGARGDAFFSPAANGFFSGNAFAPMDMVSGQSFLSHSPVGAIAQGPVSSSIEGVDVRRDFSDSAYWTARVRTDADGRATVRFRLPDSLTNWRLVVTAVSDRTHVGRLEERFRTFKPIMVWPMVPRIFTEGDEIELYASVHNRTEEARDIEVALDVGNGEILTPAKVSVRVPPGDNRPVYWTYRPERSGWADVLMTASCEAGSDASLKTLPVSALVAERVATKSGFANGSHWFETPDDVDLDNAVLELSLVPSLADDLVDTLGYLVEYPYGCVEQTMSRFLPAINVAQTLKALGREDPDLEERLPSVAEAGIKRLLELQQDDGGWGWHGGSSTHEMMTPYALYGLLEAERAGYEIPNEGAIERGLGRLRNFIDSMGEAQTADRVYCMYVYGMRESIEEEWWDFLAERLQRDGLSDYALALALELAETKGERRLARQLASKLVERADDSVAGVHWTTAGFSRWGEDRFEITAAALNALVVHDRKHELIDEIVTFFASTKRGDRWNSTKDTAMIVLSLCDLLRVQGGRLDQEAELLVAVGDRKADLVQLKSGRSTKLRIPGSELAAGGIDLRFDGTAPGAMYRAVLRYWKAGEELPAEEDGLQVTRKFFLLDDRGTTKEEIEPGDVVPRGSYLMSEVVVRRSAGRSGEMRYILVDNPKPSPCEIVPEDDARFASLSSSTTYALREDRTRGVAWHHEAINGQIVDRCVMRAELAGELTVPPAQVELMYETEVRGHSGTFRFVVGDDEARSADAR